MNFPILIVEDNAVVARTLQRFFRRYRQVIVTGTVGTARAEIFAQPGLLGAVIDWSLPDGTALDVLEALAVRGAHTPALVLTGFREPEVINAVQMRGAEYAVKPASIANLAAFVKRIEAEERRGPRSLEGAIDELALRVALSTGEKRIVALTARGVPRHLLAEELEIKENTLKSQIRTLLHKCGDAEDLGDVVRQIWRRATKES